jgi:hypothetical protein
MSAAHHAAIFGHDISQRQVQKADLIDDEDVAGESRGAVTTLSGAVSVGPTGFPFSALTPLVTSSIPTLGPKLVMGAHRVSS